MIKIKHLMSMPNPAQGGRFCHAGARRSAQALGLDWQEFVLNGLPAEQLLNTGDAMAIALVEHAKKQELK